MDTTPPRPDENQAPIVLDADLKMPEEQFGAPQEEQGGPSVLISILVGILILLLLVLGALFFFGAELFETLGFNRASQDADTVSEINTATTTETTEIDTIEAELDATDLDAIDAELEQIDAEIESSGTTTAS